MLAHIIIIIPIGINYLTNTNRYDNIFYIENVFEE